MKRWKNIPWDFWNHNLNGITGWPSTRGAYESKRENPDFENNKPSLRWG